MSERWRLGWARAESIPTGGLATMNGRPDRWVHLVFGLSISAYLLFLPADGYSDAVNNVFSGFLAVLIWTGIIKWQLPRIARWRSRDKIKQARASS